MTDSDLVDRLTTHKTLGGVPRPELEWLVAHGSLSRLEPGEMLTPKGVPPSGLHVVMSGRVAIFIDRGGARNKVMEWRGGDITGTLPYSRLLGPPGDSIAQEPTEILTVLREHLTPMIHACHEITSILVHNMVDRARAFTSSGLHDEKMVSLGKLSAGLAHELNNPAAAIERSSAQLMKRLEEAEQAARALGATRLTDPQITAVDALRESCALTPAPGVRSPVEQAQREEKIADWLEDHGLDSSMSDVFAETSVTIEELDRLAGAVDATALQASLRSAAAGCSVRSLAADIQEAATRIAGLVIAIKGFTHMDQAAVAEPVDVVQGLRNTVMVLRSKARDRSATVAIQAEPGLPRARGFAGELNQIWANLIDNALDAIPESGRVDVLAHRGSGGVVSVRVVDNGSGIPPELRERIFEPFFSTKGVGLGSGLGLDIVWRLVRHNEGQIVVDSRPGRTEFRVTLPMADGDGGGPA